MLSFLTWPWPSDSPSSSLQYPCSTLTSNGAGWLAITSLHTWAFSDQITSFIAEKLMINDRWFGGGSGDPGFESRLFLVDSVQLTTWCQRSRVRIAIRQGLGDGRSKIILILNAEDIPGSNHSSSSLKTRFRASKEGSGLMEFNSRRIFWVTLCRWFPAWSSSEI